MSGRQNKFFPLLKPKLHRASYFPFVYRPGTLCHKYLVFKTGNFYLLFTPTYLDKPSKNTHHDTPESLTQQNMLSTVSFLHDNLRYGVAQHFAIKQQHSCQHFRFRGLLYDTFILERIALGLGVVSVWFGDSNPHNRVPVWRFVPLVLTCAIKFTERG